MPSLCRQLAFGGLPFFVRVINLVSCVVSKATNCFKRHGPACQTPRILSSNTALLIKRHVLFQKKCQKPHSISKDLTFAQVDFLHVKRYVAFG